MAAAARVGDPTNHPGSISGPGVSSVLIGGQAASVLGDFHACSYTSGTDVHPTTAMMSGSSSVLIGSRPAVRVGDSAACGAAVASGMPSVLIGG